MLKSLNNHVNGNIIGWLYGSPGNRKAALGIVPYGSFSLGL